MARNDGERLIDGRCPLLVFESQGSADRPLVVFLPGAVHLARVGYGLPWLQPTDFLAHWFAEAGVPFLACSYPASTVDPAFPEVDPATELVDFTAAVADQVVATIEAAGLGREVVVVAWSALGNASARLQLDLAARDVRLGTFVSLAATPAVPNLTVGSGAGARGLLDLPDALTPEGLLRRRTLRVQTFIDELADINDGLGRAVIPLDDYADRFLADMPVNLFPGLEARSLDGRLVFGNEPSLTVSGAADWADHPFVAAVVPTLPSDLRHVISDRHNWAMVNVNMIYWRLLADRKVELAAAPHWPEIVAIVDELSTTLHRSVAGGHLFFIGEPGARATVEAVIDLDHRRRTLEGRLMETLDRSSGSA